MDFFKKNWMSILGGLFFQGGLMIFESYTKEKEREEMKREIENEIRNEMYQKNEEKESV